MDLIKIMHLFWIEVNNQFFPSPLMAIFIVGWDVFKFCMFADVLMLTPGPGAG